MAFYVHKYYPEMTCETVEATQRGWKVLQTDPRHKRKPKIAYYSDIDFSADKGVWVKKEVQNR